MVSQSLDPEAAIAPAVSGHQQTPEVDVSSSSSPFDKEVNEEIDANDSLTEPHLAAEDGNNSDIPAITEAETQSVYSTGLIVDSGSDHMETDSDKDSAYGTSVYSTTQSVRSSLYDFVEENGRTYHRFKEGKYHLPNDEVSPLPQHILTSAHVSYRSRKTD